MFSKIKKSIVSMFRNVGRNTPAAAGPLRGGRKKEGAVYVSRNGFFSLTENDPFFLRKIESTAQIRSKLDKRASTFFPSMVYVEILDDKGEVADKETKKIQQMIEKPNVNLHYTIVRAFLDTFVFGASLYNPVWARDHATGSAILSELRRLPPETFSQAPQNPANYVATGTVLKGVVINENGVREFWQTPQTALGDGMYPHRLKNVVIITDPTSADSVAGDSKLAPLGAYLEMLKFIWGVGMETVNQAGTPSFFIRIENPQAAAPVNGFVSDVDFANMVLSEASSTTRFQLRENMTIEQVELSPGVDVISYSDAVTKVIDNYFDISSEISKNKSGTIVGGSSRSELQIYQSAAAGVHMWLLPQFENILNDYFVINQYPPGWRCKLYIDFPPEAEFEDNFRMCELLLKYKMGDIKTVYDYLPQLESISEERIEEIKKFWESWGAVADAASDQQGESGEVDAAGDETDENNGDENEKNTKNEDGRGNSVFVDENLEDDGLDEKTKSSGKTKSNRKTNITTKKQLPQWHPDYASEGGVRETADSIQKLETWLEKKIWGVISSTSKTEKKNIDTDDGEQLKPDIYTIESEIDDVLIEYEKKYVDVLEKSAEENIKQAVSISVAGLRNAAMRAAAKKLLDEFDAVVAGAVKKYMDGLRDGYTVVGGERVYWLLDKKTSDRAAIADIVRLSFDEGVPPRDLAKKLHDVFDMRRAHADVVARTEASAIRNSVVADRYQNAGVKMVKWLAGAVPCEICDEYVDNIYTWNDIPTIPPVHPNCRCGIAPVL